MNWPSSCQPADRAVREQAAMIPLCRPCIGDQELKAVQKVFESRWLGMGLVTEEFEKALSAFLGVEHVVAVSSCSAALHLALVALELPPDAEVLVPSLTFPATIQAILMSGATPVFCDVHEDTFNMDANDAEQRITANTKAILPVHYGGVVCDMDRILDLARRQQLRVVEDAAHAFGSAYKGQMVGALGDITCFSFDPIKNITCAGGGALATNSKAVAESATLKRYLGINRTSIERAFAKNNWFYDVVAEGYRYHMSNLHAAIGLEQLARCADFKSRKLEIVRRYDHAFAGAAGLTLVQRDLDETFPFGYSVCVAGGGRDALISHLKQKGVDSRVQCIPNHLQPAFAPYRVSLPVTEHVYSKKVTLPLFVEMKDTEVEQVISAVLSFF